MSSKCDSDPVRGDLEFQLTMLNSIKLLFTNIHRLFVCFYADVPVSTSSFPSTNIYFENPLCTTAFPDTGHCPPFPEDMFGVLHNYTNPRPITVQEIEEVRDSCTSRLYVLVIGAESYKRTDNYFYFIF